MATEANDELSMDRVRVWDPSGRTTAQLAVIQKAKMTWRAFEQLAEDDDDFFEAMTELMCSEEAGRMLARILRVPYLQLVIYFPTCYGLSVADIEEWNRAQKVEAA